MREIAGLEGKTGIVKLRKRQSQRNLPNGEVRLPDKRCRRGM